MAIIAGTRAWKTWAGEFDFAVEGGGTGTYTLRSNDGPIPIGSVILEGYVDVLTAFTTSASGTGALSAEAANDIVSATVVSGAPYSTTGRKSITPASTGATAIKTTADRSPTFAIAVGAITAGKLVLVLNYR